MEFLLGIFLIGIVILIIFFYSFPISSGNQGEDTWNRWIDQHRENPEKYHQFTNEEKESMAKSNRYRTYEQVGKRGGRYETRYSKKTGKPYRHYF